MSKFHTIETLSHGGRAWIALITGPDAKWGIARNFMRKTDVTSAKSNKYRDLEWHLKLEEGEIYEYRDLGGSSSGGESGFWIVRNGTLEDISKKDVLEIVNK